MTAANNALAPAHRHTLTYFDAHLEEKTASLAAGHQVVCCFVNDEVNSAVVDQFLELGVDLIALRSAGCNNVDLEYVAKCGLSVFHVPAYSPQSVAEHALALLLTLNRKTHKVYNRVRDGNFCLEGMSPGFSLAGKTVGILGTGRIGDSFARIMVGLGCHVLGYDVMENPALLALQKKGNNIAGWGSFKYTSMDEVLRASDVLSLHMPLTPDTQGIIGGNNLKKMKKGVILINTSRGGLVDTKAVIEALKTKHIRAVGLDTYEDEEAFFYRNLSEEIVKDDQLSRLMTLSNVLITPHKGFYTQEALSAIASSTIASVSDFEGGMKPDSAIIYKGTVIKKLQGSGNSFPDEVLTTAYTGKGKGLVSTAGLSLPCPDHEYSREIIVK
ncbi:D-lactate dehydrogenase [Nannochloropsis gaditana CCMP526]|uniref:D-lactate dehydrogenase n=1 Tax=Nannochloropsis gaditana (strain CCMP526) TaxID=1093141 RepID=UPI00029F62DE|nr:D-lactate dehydrogenase [Nannochloropsis gaditana CCMP526]EKU23308.1 D-lactate dehydrogenase [Nannochloropsis gaditana CCMP526]|eukprot:XP_005852524.1 D-lactate dehydrogenase [Nannochloropsis gaditana CCMP526]